MEKLTLNISAELYGEYDVVVCGGGTAGCVAALAAAREGAKTAIIEGSGFLGGMFTAGNAGMTKYIKHAKNAEVQAEVNRDLIDRPEEALTTGGIPLELVKRLMERKAAVGTNGTAGSFVYTDSQEFKLLLFDLLKEAGVKILLHCNIFDVIKENDKVTGVIFTSKQGVMYVKGKQFIDATGDGDVSALAGADYVLGAGPDDQVVKEGIAEIGKLQIMGAMYRIGGVDYDGFIEYIKKHPEKITIHPYGLMSHEEIIETLKKGDSIILNGTLTGEKYHTEQGFIRQDPPFNYYQIYNYPREGIAVGCVTHILTDGLDGTKIDDVVQGEYEVLYCAKRQVARLREEVGGFENAFVLDVPQVGVRETRHVVGEYKIDIHDVLESRTYPDTIGFSTHPCDIGPLPKAVKEWDRPDKFYFSLPYRCLVAKGLDNLLLAGRLISNSREAAGCTRPTVACMVTGEAAGTAAAILCRDGISEAKDIDVQKLRATLKENGVVL